ncbi:hypothetical protein TBLA_0E03060 [Henningerozyma blattae CBS 6284]|uniref:Uncharacterized protein n=1 Tax=Henningerozyma blattae (strain ATCC 34711 / CBS 6284 / DSM 70876 / NBRC 10599 / NRRL Y-10934 / UCD 77-7) TaxID=1071380 RepID=I2H4Q8_HENB6|nr:hypothetical protein TBLA_0E03060 [Tetrapisispora blattae CBS 6284]CCH61360.1 hypothetical protein TBLA_0E03060 [Tetrapisispora blattae CBS 6284]
MVTEVQRRKLTSSTEEGVELLYGDNQQQLNTSGSSGKRLYTWDEIPVWQHDNEYIYTGYVRETNSMKESFLSLFYIHNESVNIYTHLIPAFCFLSMLLFNTYGVKPHPTTTYGDYVAIDLFFIGAFTCLGLSSTFHCFKSHSLKISVFGNKLDYLGIVILISTSLISVLYFGYHDDPFIFYIFSGITLCFGIACGIASLKDKFRTREWRPYRAALFVLFGLSGVLPIIAGIMKYGIREVFERVQLKWIIWEGVLYIFGAFLYGARFPEKFMPGKVDIWGQSHQIFHVLVVIAALCHLRGLIGSYELVHQKLDAQLQSIT